MRVHSRRRGATLRFDGAHEVSVVSAVLAKRTFDSMTLSGDRLLV
jgi:hypothetical protein